MSLTGAAYGADIYSPMALTPSSFNADVVVEKTAAWPIENYVTASNDSGTNLNTGNVWFEMGYCGTNMAGGWGLPPHGSIFAAEYLPTGAVGPDPNFVFQMPPDYTVNNAVFVSANNGPRTATITITNPAPFMGLSFFECSGNGGETINYTVHHQDTTTETGSFVSTDWWHGNGSAPYPAWMTHCLLGISGNGLQQINGANGDVYHNEITLTNTASPVISIDFALVGTGGRMSLFAISGSTDGVAYTNTLGLSGFNADMIVEATAPAFNFDANYCTATMERGTLDYGQVYMEKGFNGAAYGLPAPGTTFTNSAANHAFTMPPDYTKPNTLLCAGTLSGITYGPTGGTLTLTTPMAYQAISFLCGATWGPKNFDVTVHHADGTTESFTAVPAPDWYNTSGTIAGTYPATLAYASGEGFTVETLGFNIASADYRLFAVDVTLANTASPVTSVDCAYSATQSQGTTAVAFIMGLAGSTGSTTPAFLPALVTGFNEDMIVEKAAVLRPNRLNGATTASMDGGTANTGNTWYEQGFYHAFPLSGLPPAGSTVHSVAQANSYVMPSTYIGNNAAYIDSAHTNANLTPAVPAPYTALSFLSSDANGFVTNRVITQYQDGTADTNTFVSYDWFNNTPYAFIAYGRVNLDNPSINNDPGAGGSNPRLYEAQVGLNNTTSPLTNVVLNFLGGSGGSSRMVVMAVSAATGPYPVIFRGITTTAPTALEGTNMTLSAWTAGVAAGVTYQWQMQSNGVWLNLTDGAIGFSGCTTLTNTFATYPGWLTNVGSPMTGGACNFRVQASNSVAVVYSGTLTVTLLSGYPDIPAVGDPIANFGGSSQVYDAGAPGMIDHLVGTSPDCKDLIGGLPTANPVNCGFTTTPSGGSSIARAIRIFTANDTQGRDPTDVKLDGSLDGGTTWINILPLQTFALNANRNVQNPSQAPNPLTQYYQEFDFYTNTMAFTSYRVTFQDVNTPSGAMMQVAEVQVLGQSLNTTPPYFTVQPPAAQTVFVGASPTFAVVAGGAPLLHYQWYSNNVAVSGATSPTFKVSNVTAANSGNQFYCHVYNANGVTNSIVDTLAVIAPPTQLYPATVLADHPISFYRLDEGPDNHTGNNGTIANDYIGGFYGSYSNVVLGVAGYSPTVDTDTAAGFGQVATTDSMIPDINQSFGAATGQSATFSVEAWVQSVGEGPTTDAGIVTVGYGGFDQFNLDCGGNPAGASTSPHNFRFYVRDAVGGTHGATGGGTISPSDLRWHHLVGVCDEVHSNVVLYVDGIKNAIDTGFKSGLGILSPTTPLSIGSRRANTGSDYNDQFIGTIDDVALYNYALSSTQVLAHFYASQPAPVFTVQPTNTTVGEGSTLTLYSSAYGPGTLGYQWFVSTDPSAGSFVPVVPSQTSSNLIIPNVSATLSGLYYYVVVTNAYGAITSSVPIQPGALVTVQSGPPSILVDLPASQFILGGSTLTLSVQAAGSAPFTYQWTYNGANLSDGGRIFGAHSNILTIADVLTNDAGVYQVSILNAYSGGFPTSSQMDTLSVLPELNLNGGTGWQLQGTLPPVVVNNSVTLTDGGASENGSFYFQNPVEIATPWQASFLYQVVNPVTGYMADGTCFVIHNDPRGASVLSGGGGSFGISGVAPSAEIELNLYSGANGGEGFAFNYNGNVGNVGGANNTPTAPVVLDSGNPIRVNVSYGFGVIYVTLTDTGTQATWSTSVNLGTLGTDLPTLVGGNTAYVGFSGATGGVSSYQKVSNFTFVSVPSLTVHATGAGTAIISWPPTAGSFVLQSKSSLTAGTWQTDNSPITVVNGQNQATVTPAGNTFYRLILQ